MRGITHIVIGVGATSLMIGTADPIVLFIGAAATLLPDIDKSDSIFGQVLPWVSRSFEKRFPHRSCTHSLVASGVVAIATYPLAIFGFLPWDIVHALNLGYFVGYLADQFTKSGIEMFWPHPVRCVCPGNRNLRLQTGSSVEYGILVILSAIAIFVIGINMHGGIKTQFNRVTATPDGVVEFYKQKSSNHIIIAHIEGVYSSDSQPVHGDFWVIDRHGKDFIVQSKKGEIYKAGSEPDAELETDSITADVGPPAAIRVTSIYLDNDEISTALERFDRPNTMVYVSGVLKIDNPVDLQISQDSRQFTTMRESSDGITLKDAPLATVQRKLGDQSAKGNLLIRSIFLEEP